MKKRTDLGLVVQMLLAGWKAHAEYFSDGHRYFGVRPLPAPTHIDNMTRRLIEQVTGEPITYVAFELQTRVDAYWLYKHRLTEMIDDLMTDTERGLVDTLLFAARAFAGSR